MARYRCLHFYLTPEQTGREKTSKQHYDEHSIYLGLSLDIVDFAIKKGVVATSSRNSVSVDALLQIIDFVERQSRQLTIDSMLILKARAAAAALFLQPFESETYNFRIPGNDQMEVFGWMWPLPLHRRLQPLRYLPDCFDCYWLERSCRAGFAPTEKPCLRTSHEK
jgi:hypothetical protein